MKDIIIGIIIAIVCFFIIDFIDTEKNVCSIKKCDTCGIEEYKCGILYNKLDWQIDIFNRYW